MDTRGSRGDGYPGKPRRRISGEAEEADARGGRGAGAREGRGDGHSGGRGDGHSGGRGDGHSGGRGDGQLTSGS
ncbi:hypothetical protein CRI70_21515 [Streptomyces sp. Ru87]|nr:hypothetical protein CRI70_21515 [Streptomyces sp. Ru87]